MIEGAGLCGDAAAAAAVHPQCERPKTQPGARHTVPYLKTSWQGVGVRWSVAGIASMSTVSALTASATAAGCSALSGDLGTRASYAWWRSQVGGVFAPLTEIAELEGTAE